jgi:hypothetical protein
MGNRTKDWEMMEFWNMTTKGNKMFNFLCDLRGLCGEYFLTGEEK